jgi:hypothetical protein
VAAARRGRPGGVAFFWCALSFFETRPLDADNASGDAIDAVDRMDDDWSMPGCAAEDVAPAVFAPSAFAGETSEILGPMSAGAERVAPSATELAGVVAPASDVAPPGEAPRAVSTLLILSALVAAELPAPTFAGATTAVDSWLGAVSACVVSCGRPLMARGGLPAEAGVVGMVGVIDELGGVAPVSALPCPDETTGLPEEPGASAPPVAAGAVAIWETDGNIGTLTCGTSGDGALFVGWLAPVVEDKVAATPEALEGLPVDPVAAGAVVFPVVGLLDSWPLA